MCLVPSLLKKDKERHALRNCRAGFGRICFASRSGNHLQHNPCRWALGFSPQTFTKRQATGRPASETRSGSLGRLIQGHLCCGLPHGTCTVFCTANDTKATFAEGWTALRKRLLRSPSSCLCAAMTQRSLRDPGFPMHRFFPDRSRDPILLGRT